MGLIMGRNVTRSTRGHRSGDRPEGGGRADASSSTEERLLRVAFEIHNGPAQCLATALALLRALDRRLPPEMTDARESLRATIGSTETALESTRRAIGMLRSSGADDAQASLASHLRDALDEVRPHTRAALSLDVPPLDDLPSAIVTGLAEVGREALVNAARHAAARHIAVRVQRTRHAIVLEVKDDGDGFEGGRPGGFGLALMHDQVRLLGGTLHIRKGPGEGTLVRASIPLPERLGAPGRRMRRAASA